MNSKEARALAEEKNKCYNISEVIGMIKSRAADGKLELELPEEKISGEVFKQLRELGYQPNVCYIGRIKVRW